MARSNGRIAEIAMAFAAGFATADLLSAYRRDLRRARQRIREGSRVAATSRGPVEFAEAGEGAPILVVHGAGGGFDQGLDFALPLAARGFRVIAMSRFGYLRTPLPADASPEAQADGYAALLDVLGIRRASILGASAGAPSALQFALRHADRCSALVLMVPALYAPRPDGEASRLPTPAVTQVVFDTALRSDLLFWAAIRLARPVLIRSLLATPPAIVDRADPHEQQRVDRMLEHILPVSERRLGLLNDARITSTLRREPLDRVAAKTLVISVVDDLFGTYDVARFTAAEIPGARFVGYANGGHVWVGHEQEAVMEIEHFLR